MLKSNRDPTQRYKVIIVKPTYAGDEMHSSLENFGEQFQMPTAIGSASNSVITVTAYRMYYITILYIYNKNIFVYIV